MMMEWQIDLSQCCYLHRRHQRMGPLVQGWYGTEGRKSTWWDLYNEGNVNVKPNKFVYNAAITAWSRSTHKGASHKAQRLLDKMWEWYEETGDLDRMKDGTVGGTVDKSRRADGIAKHPQLDREVDDMAFKNVKLWCGAVTQFTPES